MEENPIDDWYSNDEGLKKIIDEISSTNKSPEEQASEAFYSVSELYHLPKFTEDLTEEVYEKYEAEGNDNPRTVFEEVGIIRYLEPDEDPRGIVLLALYNVKNRSYTDIDHCAMRHFKGTIPSSYMVCFLGKDADSRLEFVEGDESWVRPGVRCAMRILKSS